MKTAPAVALLAEFPSAPVTAVLDQTTVVTPMVKTLLDYCIFFVYGTFSDVFLKFGADFIFCQHQILAQKLPRKPCRLTPTRPNLT